METRWLYRNQPSARCTCILSQTELYLIDCIGVVQPQVLSDSIGNKQQVLILYPQHPIRSCPSNERILSLRSNQTLGMSPPYWSHSQVYEQKQHQHDHDQGF